MATITIRIDDELKKGFDDVLNELGISQTEVIINTCKYIVQNKKLPFVVVQQFKTPKELKKDLFDKMNNAFIVMKDLSNSLKNNKSIYPNHRKIIISTLRDFTHYFDWFTESLKHLFPSNEFFLIQKSRMDVGYLALILGDISNNADHGELSEKLTPTINLTLESFEQAFKDISPLENSEKEMTNE
ncbi:type II toxin-antitoxin system RelB/DinJ family antitoxin [Yersinia enterocolitica]|uniref:type II toxin-antitoxin system RelB/DinJ family antitoxin n=1 Tax=Yersinia enterocolitica TaxID=630 RepID=UPI00330FA355|nr:type II toxin-antitoxin system RelB/DinJ family antitoxin [Yersinia enterocolitica]